MGYRVHMSAWPLFCAFILAITELVIAIKATDMHVYLITLFVLRTLFLLAAWSTVRVSLR